MFQLSTRIRAIEREIERAVVITEPPPSPSKVSIGTKVTYQVEGENHPRTCVIVGYGEGDHQKKWVAYDSPIGEAILGAGLGEEVEIPRGSEVVIARIIDIQPAEKEVFGLENARE
ncbi:MAG: GreA/GreB family elongation factor [Sandaracinaceae bacterium]|nr:GreA/GreB family elongation factor [Sandaracinaceae bacterium]MDW8244989.1 GreA/GreB family elongation factor [Sandaracinaceae bacterium]